jgi:nucleotide-binding universal stress UspA family protein
MSFQRILIAVDRESVSSRAVDIALDLAASLKADVSIVHVMTPPVTYGTPSGLPNSELMALARQEGSKLLAELRQNPALPALAHAFLEAGDPTTEIVRTAKEWPADVIVVGSHGREGVARMMLGSVAESVIHQAPCPVLVVRLGV